MKYSLDEIEPCFMWLIKAYFLAEDAKFVLKTCIQVDMLSLNRETSKAAGEGS